jgi:glutaredoxin
MENVTVTLYSRPGCHLCESAFTTLQELREKLASLAAIEISEISIASDPILEKKYSDYIPVILINGQPHDFYAVNEDRFIAAIKGIVN